MKIKFIVLYFLMNTALTTVFAQNFPPCAGEIGSTAIHKDSSCFVAWADKITVKRGYIQITDTTLFHEGSNRASFGIPEDALGKAQGDNVSVVSLGDSGIAVLEFPMLIQNGPGFDFAIFENGFQNNYIELAHVEVSSDGIHYFRFPSTSLVQTTTQLDNGSFSDCSKLDGLAGKYKSGFGTPFDLSILADAPNLNKSAIRFIKLIDAIGNIGNGGKTVDSKGNIINDLFPTPFYSSGFDLDAVGIINGVLKTHDNQLINIDVYPNPFQNFIQINGISSETELKLVDQLGRIIWQQKSEFDVKINTEEFENGTYLLQLNSNLISYSIAVVKN